MQVDHIVDHYSPPTRACPRATATDPAPRISGRAAAILLLATSMFLIAKKLGIHDVHYLTAAVVLRLL